MKTYKELLEKVRAVNEERKYIKINTSKLDKLQSTLPAKVVTIAGGTLIGNIIDIDSKDKSFVAISGPDTNKVMDTVAYRYGLSNEKRIKEYHAALLDRAADEKQAIKTLLAIGKEMMSWEQINREYVKVGKKFQSKMYLDAHAKDLKESEENV